MRAAIGLIFTYFIKIRIVMVDSTLFFFFFFFFFFLFFFFFFFFSVGPSG
jgi:hypothetical protein